MAEPTDKAIADLQEQLNALHGVMDRVKRELGPVWDDEAALKNLIAETHGGPGKFNPAGAPRRKPAFDKLMDSSVKHGPTKRDYARLKKLTNAYTRDLASLERELMKQRSKGK